MVSFFAFDRPIGLAPCFVEVFALLVCAASLVSVTVRLASLSRTSTTRHTGHHSRFVQGFLLPASAARRFHAASMIAPFGAATHRRPMTRGPPGRRNDAGADP